MNLRIKAIAPILSALITSILLAACSSTPKAPDGAAEVRAKLTQLQSDSQLATLAPVAIKDAEAAVSRAEEPRKDTKYSQHLVYLADRKVDTAVALATARLLEDKRKDINDQATEAQLASRTQEADALRRQLAELNAKQTERGLVITLGDVLFETGKADLKGTATANLAKLTAFLTQHPDRSLVIEGHTDSVGSESYNQVLSQNRADSVKAFLLNQGVASNRITAFGKGESSPVASNDSSSGRQMNRRVEVIIATPGQASAGQ
ncbi:MAG: OmpA family protein [Cellvibrio sp.]|uniref:OmpA family protein n=1 Tax=Cellvibrio sp. TaxID=1965322 RepID=UPI0027249885|nr:OmpA family protein [Cellvibrio sp.]